MQFDEHTELRRASSPGFWEMWIGGRFVGMYYTLERAKQAAGSHYGDACRRKYAEAKS